LESEKVRRHRCCKEPMNSNAEACKLPDTEELAAHGTNLCPPEQHKEVTQI